MLRELMPTTPAKRKTTMRDIAHVDPSRLRYLFASSRAVRSDADKAARTLSLG